MQKVNHLLRGMLGILSGVLLVNSFATYGGMGISLWLIAADQQAPQDLALKNIFIGTFGVVIAVLMLGSAILLFAEFLQKKIRFTKKIGNGIVTSVIALSLIHIVAYLGLGQIQDVYVGKFIDGFVFGAAQALIASILFLIVKQLRAEQE